MRSSRVSPHVLPLRIEDYDRKAIEDLNVPYPMTWEESVVNLVVLDMLRAN